MLQETEVDIFAFRDAHFQNAGDFYPRGEKPEEINYAATLHLPPGWAFATALPIEKRDVDDVSSTVQHESGSPDPTSSLCLPLLDLHLKSKSFFRARCSSVSRSAKQRESGCGHDCEPGVAFFPFLPINARVLLLFPRLIL